MKYSIYSCLCILLLASCEDVISVPDISEDIVEVTAPLNNAVLEEGAITFSWEELAFTDEYQVQIATPSFIQASQVVLDTIVGDSIQSIRSITKTLAPEVYEWRIRGLNSEFTTAYAANAFTVQSSIGIEDISNDVVTILAPINNAEIEEGLINFNWDSVENASQYRLQIVQPDFENAIQFVTDTLIINNNFSIQLGSNFYEWRIQALNDISETAFTTQSITILEEEIPLSDQNITLITPEDNFETSDTMVTLSWDALDDANLYRIQIINTADNSLFIEETTVNQEITIEFVSGTYEWSVRAENDGENSPYSSRSLTIL